jgi:diguanylate cyclase (GGDEF)-like protein/PAS domain S-box-containing protein
VLHVRDHSIRVNLTLLILFTSALAVALASLGFGIYERQNYRDSAVREMSALADSLGASSAASVASDDADSAETLLDSLATEPHVLGAYLYDSDGGAFARYASEGSGNARPALRADGAYFDQESLTVYRGVTLNGERVGSIAVVFDLNNPGAPFAQYVKIAMLVFLMSVVATFFLSLRLAVRISEPLIQLAAVARRVSTDKDYTARARIEAGGETGSLIRSFNEMLDGIESRQKALNDALASLRESEERYALAARGANDGLWDWNLLSGEIYFSPRWDHMLGYSVNSTWNRSEDWFHYIHADDRERVRGEIAAHCSGLTTEFTSEYRMHHRSGGYLWMLSRGIVVRDQTGRPVRMAGSQTDITDSKIADPLTRIPNRPYFVDRLEGAMDAAAQTGLVFAVLLIDLDHFKLINDSLGHMAGDELLIDVAGRLRASVRVNARPGGQLPSMVARIDGDKFAILLGITEDAGEAVIVAARILERLGEAFHLEGRRTFVSASIGVAMSTSAQTPEDLIRNADTAMHHAKEHGKGRSEFFTTAMRDRVVNRFEIEGGLRHAIEAELLLLHYQPIISLGDNRIAGFEALVRWNHPGRGLIAPGEFIPIAEESELIILLGRWVLRKACRQMADWHRTFPAESRLTIHVNVSSRHLDDPRLVEDVKLALAESDLPAACLALEVTESSLIGSAEETRETLDRLREMGVKLEIDDFGTGYSSLSYLRRLAFDTLKIDRSFINELSTGTDSLDIVKAIVEMAHSLKLKVIAEGVETSGQLLQVRELGCDAVQGFLYSTPVDGTTAEWLYNKTRERGFSPTGGAEPVPVIASVSSLRS